jgi:DNA repair exonuclease SbcCD ATPase subunit
MSQNGGQDWFRSLMGWLLSRSGQTKTGQELHDGNASRGDDGDDLPAKVAKLLDENEELKARIEHLHSLHMGCGAGHSTPSGEDESQIATLLQQKLKEQNTQLESARKRLEILESYQDMARGLRIENDELSSKVTHQTALLHSLAADNPGQKALVSKVEELTEENRRLKERLFKQSELLGRLKDHLPPSALEAVETLLNRNTRLYADLEAKDAQLEIAASMDSGVSILDRIERLSERNIQLKSLVETKGLIDSLIGDQETSGGDPTRILESLRMEGRHLEHALSTREEEIQVLSADPENRRLLKAYSRLEQQYREVFKENQHKDQLYRQDQSEKKSLMAQARERTALIKENQRLHAQLNSYAPLIEDARKKRAQWQALKTESSEIQARYREALGSLDELGRKYETVSAAYEQLVQDYRKVFPDV